MSTRPRGSGGPEEGTPEYDWLYGKGGARASDDATRVIPSAGTPRPDQTRVMPVVPRAAEGPTPRRHETPPPPPPPSPPQRRRSFRPSFRFGMVKWVLLAWLVFLVAVPFWAWSRV
ncbi:MAG: LCP family protein, partial [Nocardioides sp.]